MSHTTEIDGIKITDVAALRSAINELKAQGVKCDLLENAIPRAYYPDQQGLGNADFVLKLHDSRYDVGLYKENGKQEYATRCDFWNQEIERILGAPAQDGESQTQARLGKLYQTYAIHAATNAAVQQGYSVQRVNQANGTVQLLVTGV